MPCQPHPYLARMARFSNGPEHAARRADVLAALPPAEGLARDAYDRTVRRADGRLDVMPLLRTIPVAVLGAALAVGDLSTEIGELCDHGVIAPGLPDVAVTSLLFQCRNATAALIANALTDGLPAAEATSVVLTRRAEDTWVLLADAPFGRGAHACPGQDHALVIATAIIAALRTFEVVERGPNDPQPNVRIPAFLIMQPRSPAAQR